MCAKRSLQGITWPVLLLLLALCCYLGATSEDEAALSSSEIVHKATEAESQSNQLRKAAESQSKRAESLRRSLAVGKDPARAKRSRDLKDEISQDHAETLRAIRSQQQDDLQACQGNLRRLLRQRGTQQGTPGVPEVERLLAPQVDLPLNSTLVALL